MKTKRKLNETAEINAETLSDWRNKYDYHSYYQESKGKLAKFLRKLFRIKASEIPDWVHEKSEDLQRLKIKDGSLYGKKIIRSLSGIGIMENKGIFCIFKSKKDYRCIAVLLDEREDSKHAAPFYSGPYNDPPERAWIIAVFDRNTGQSVTHSLFDEFISVEQISVKHVIELD